MLKNTLTKHGRWTSIYMREPSVGSNEFGRPQMIDGICRFVDETLFIIDEDAVVNKMKEWTLTYFAPFTFFPAALPSVNFFFPYGYFLACVPRPAV